MNCSIVRQERRKNYYLFSRVGKVRPESIEKSLIGTVFDLECVQCQLGPNTSCSKPVKLALGQGLTRPGSSNRVLQAIQSSSLQTLSFAFRHPGVLG